MIENRRMQYLYADGDNHVFMDNESFEQTELSSDYLKEELNYLKKVWKYKFKHTKVKLSVLNYLKLLELTVTETEPGIKGDTATGATKSATVETGYTLNVPLFVNEGDVLIINTGDGSYISRG